ncbi:hypothetical protein ACFV5G_29570 [Streptomyces sp. NPDC059766]
MPSELLAPSPQCGIAEPTTAPYPKTSGATADSPISTSATATRASTKR